MVPDAILNTVTAGTGALIPGGVSGITDIYKATEDKTPNVGLYESVTYEFEWTYSKALFPAPFEKEFCREDFEKKVVIRDCFRADPINDFTEVVEVFDGGFWYNGIDEGTVEYQNIG